MKFWRFIFAILLAAFFVIPAQTYAKSYYFPSVISDISVMPDSSISVVEKRTFTFEGSFSRIYWDIPLRSDQSVQDVALSEDDTPQVKYEEIPSPDSARPVHKFSAERQGNSEHIEAYHSSYNEDRTFTLSYTVTNAVTSYNDVSELYWQAIGKGWDARTDSAQITVHLPSAVDKNQIYVWGHGPLNGQAQIIDGSTAAFNVKNVPQNNFVEVRVLFPAALVTSGPKINETALSRIQKEEKSFQDETILRARAAYGATIASGALLILWIVFWFVVWYKNGREYYEGVPKYFHEPPSALEPALVEALITQGLRVSANAFSATILDLARKKYIQIEAQETISKGFLGLGAGSISYKYILHKDTKRYPSKKPLKDFEQALYDFIFSYAKDSDVVSIDDLKTQMKGDPFKSRNFSKTSRKW